MAQSTIASRPAGVIAVPGRRLLIEGTPNRLALDFESASPFRLGFLAPILVGIVGLKLIDG